VRRIGLVVIVLASFAAAPLAHAAAPAPEAEQRYIVVLRSDANPEQVAAAHREASSPPVRQGYRDALTGYAASMPPSQAARPGSDPQVVSVEVDQIAHATQTTPTGVDRAVSPAVNSQVLPNLTIDGVDDQRVDADIAVIDSGVDASHPDLNVVGGVSCVSLYGTSSSCTTVTPTDPNGHGTHVAGTAAAKDNSVGVVGVAPGARVWSVRVLGADGNGYLSDIVAGINWVTSRASTIEVANVSLGCECTSSAMNTAITNSVAAGVTYTVAAGNNAKDASTFSPANHPSVITVSALADFDGRSGGTGSATCRSDQDDTLADFSNYGSTVEIAAPGVCISSTLPGGTYASNWSGTSMASPHVAGAAADLASTMGHVPSAIRDKLITTGNHTWSGVNPPTTPILDVTTFVPKTVAVGTAPAPAPAPTADFSMKASPSSQTIPRGRSATYSVSITRLSGFTSGVTLSASTLPAGWTASFSPNPVAGSSSTLTIRTSSYSARTTSTVTITGTGGGKTHTATVSLTVK
jgi:subtilisin family serine protease